MSTNSDKVATVSFVVCVDDFVMVGTELLVNIIAEIRKNIKIYESAGFLKYFGCVLHVTQNLSNPKFGHTTRRSGRGGAWFARKLRSPMR